jgi:signal transduction histidine kinase
MTALLRPGVHSVDYLAGGLLAPVLATLAGVAGREHKQKAEIARREQAAALAAHRLAVNQAATGERLRIAREMHDAIGHGVTVATLAAEAASKLAHRDPERAGEFLEVVVRTGRQTMQELHQLLGVLRSEPDNPAASPAETLDEVVRRYANLGLETSLKVGDDYPTLPAHVDRAITAIVAEGLANTTRHAGAHQAVVELAYETGLLRVTVTDDGRGPGSAEFGYGLTGAAERARSLGGRLHLQASPTGGTRLEAAIPYPVDATP